MSSRPSQKKAAPGGAAAGLGRSPPVPSGGGKRVAPGSDRTLNARLVYRFPALPGAKAQVRAARDFIRGQSSSRPSLQGPSHVANSVKPRPLGKRRAGVNKSKAIVVSESLGGSRWRQAHAYRCPSVAPIATGHVAAPRMTRCAMCGRLRVGKSFLHVCSIGRCSHVFGL